MARLLPADNTTVYALYNQTRPTALFLSSIFILDFACLTYANTLAIESIGSVKDFEPPPVNPTGLTIFRRGTIFKVGVKEKTADRSSVNSIAFALGQSVVLIMTLGKYALGIPQGWSRNSLLSKVLRNGIITYGSMFGKPHRSPTKER